MAAVVRDPGRASLLKHAREGETEGRAEGCSDGESSVHPVTLPREPPGSPFRDGFSRTNSVLAGGSGRFVLAEGPMNSGVPTRPSRYDHEHRGSVARSGARYPDAGRLGRLHPG